MDADGDLDFLVGSTNYEALLVTLGNGGGGPSGRPSDFPLTGLPLDVGAGDVDADGVVDVLALTTEASPLLVLHGLGAGAFAPPQAFATVADPDDFALALVDHDGDGAGVFLPAVAHVEGVQTYGDVHWADASDHHGGLAWDAAVADLDADGAPDAVLVGYEPQEVVVRYGDGTGLFGARTIHPLGDYVVQVDLGDLDQDGELVALLRTAPLPAGTAPYGAGTPGCQGAIALSANGAPGVGDAGFAMSAANALPGAVGALAVAAGQGAGGSDPLGLGVLLHVDPASPLHVVPVLASEAGVAHVPLPIPGSPGLSGSTLFAQALFASPPAPPCWPTALGLSSSRGLALSLP